MHSYGMTALETHGYLQASTVCVDARIQRLDHLKTFAIETLNSRVNAKCLSLRSSPTVFSRGVFAFRGTSGWNGVGKL